MRIIKTITDNDLFGDDIASVPKRFHNHESYWSNGCSEREAARAVLFDENNNVAILDVTTRNFHKIPGGGIEDGEDVLFALKRECMEETGCEIEITAELGVITEIREKLFRQNSHGYLARVTKPGSPNFIGYEITEKYELLWIPIDEAIELFEQDQPDDYSSHFMQRRDMEFLRAAKELLSKL